MYMKVTYLIVLIGLFTSVSLIEEGYATTTVLPDSDGDGVPDNTDKCPNKVETINKFEDSDGCPDSEQPIEVDINFNKDTKDISISWNFGENRESCHAKTEIWLNNVRYYYFGEYNNELIPGQKVVGITDEEEIDCSGDMILNFSDFTDAEVNAFGLFMDFAMKEFQTQKINLAEIGFIYNTKSNPGPITCGVASHFDSFTDFVDLVIGPKIAIKTKVVDSFCESGIPQPIIQFSAGINSQYINPDLQKKKGNGGCSDCTPPTLGLDKTYKRIVDDGFSYNGNMVQVEKWYTDFPLINATVGIPNLVEIKVYENTGITNMKWVQFCLGAEERGQPLNSCEVLIEVHLYTNGTTTGVMVDDIVINDKENLIDNDTVTAVSYVIPCMEYGTEPNCVKVDLEYTYREETFNHMLIVNVLDKARNSQNFHFNEGVNVLGESVNESPSITLSNKHASQQKDDLYITYTKTDKITDTWTDQYGIEYHRINDVTFDRITPADSYECTDPTLDKVKVWKRTNCHFRALTSLWSYN